MRLSLEEVEKRKERLDACPLSIFEHLTELKSFFVEVSLQLRRWLISAPDWLIRLGLRIGGWGLAGGRCFVIQHPYIP